MRKGLQLTANFLATVILILVAIFIVSMLFFSFTGDAGKPVSNIAYKVFDWLAGILA